MITTDIKSLLERMNPFCARCLEDAAGSCLSRTNYEITVEHYLHRILAEPCADATLILGNLGIEPAALQRRVEQILETLKTDNCGKPVFSPLLIELLEDAWIVSSIDWRQEQIRSGALLSAIVHRRHRLAEGRHADFLRTVSREAVTAQLRAVAARSLEHPNPVETTGKGQSAPSGRTSLQRFCQDFTLKARTGDIDPVLGRDRETSMLIDILARRRKNNPIIIGEAGVGKTALVEGLALRIAQDDVPDILKGVTVLGLDMGLLQAGAGVKGEFENRLKSVIAEIKSSPAPIILFIDEAHTLIGAGNPAGGGDAANLLKPVLARGELRTIAATTWSEYKKYFEKDDALARRFQPVKVDEPDAATAVLILRGLKDSYEAAHGVTVRDDAIVAAVELASRYISGRQLPDKAVDLLDTAAARVRIMLSARPDSLENNERAMHALEREKKALTRDALHGIATDRERPCQIERELAGLRADNEALRERWAREKEAVSRVLEARKELAWLVAEGGDRDRQLRFKEDLARAAGELEFLQSGSPLVRVEVDPDVVSKVVSDWTGIPLGSVLRDQVRDVVNMKETLKQRIKGQDEAIDIISEIVMASKAGLSDARQPQGIFLLVGPSGVGKTETGNAVAELLFGGERFLTAVNMSEFQEGHTVSRLIGSPPGYIGFGEGGILTEAVRQRPYSVILIDEVEKAHPDVVNLFYQVFDKGTLSDGEGRVIDFRNTVFFLTSNLAADLIMKFCKNGRRPSAETLAGAIRPVLSAHFQQALLARMTVVPFYTLDPSHIREIASLKMARLAAWMAENRKITLTCSPEVAGQIAARCTEVESGARNIDHIMRGTILPRLSREILSRMGEEKTPAEVRLEISGNSINIHFS